MGFFSRLFNKGQAPIDIDEMDPMAVAIIQEVSGIPLSEAREIVRHFCGLLSEKKLVQAEYWQNATLKVSTFYSARHLRYQRSELAKGFKTYYVHADDVAAPMIWYILSMRVTHVLPDQVAEPFSASDLPALYQSKESLESALAEQWPWLEGLRMMRHRKPHHFSTIS